MNRPMHYDAASEKRKKQTSFPYLARMLELPMDAADEERVQFLSRRSPARPEFLEAVMGYVGGQASRHPLVLVWEDLHWCDPSSAQVLEALLPLTRELPLLILSAARPEESGDDRCQDEALLIRLSPLTREESGSLIGELLRIENLPEHTRELILNRAEGNPFFLEELLRALIDAGVVVMAAGRAVAAGEIESFEDPQPQEVLAARIDRLPTAQKQALQRASVVGRVFQQRVLAHLYEERKRSQVVPLLGELQERRFLQPFVRDESGVPKHDEYTFQHAITHEVAYGSIFSLSQRKEFHQLVAEAIEQLFPERQDELAATLGYSFRQGEE